MRVGERCHTMQAILVKVPCKREIEREREREKEIERDRDRARTRPA